MEEAEVLLARRSAGDGEVTPAGRGSPAEGRGTGPRDKADGVKVLTNNAENKPNNVAGRAAEDGGGGGEGTLVNGKRKKIRRKQKGGSHHRKWKPYNKLTWEERQTLEERETKRACRKRESRFASGQAMAPYNTTQFLMEQHEPSNSELNLDDSHPPRERTVSRGSGGGGGGGPGRDLIVAGTSGGSVDGSSEDVDSNDEEIFLEKDFTEAYEQYRAETLQNMSKEQLVREHLELEEEIESLKKQLKMVECASRRSGVAADVPDDLQRLQAIELLKQVKRLKEENERLRCENARLTGAGDGGQPVDGST